MKNREKPVGKTNLNGAIAKMFNMDEKEYDIMREKTYVDIAAWKR